MRKRRRPTIRLRDVLAFEAVAGLVAGCSLVTPLGGLTGGDGAEESVDDASADGPVVAPATSDAGSRSDQGAPGDTGSPPPARDGSPADTGPGGGADAGPSPPPRDAGPQPDVVTSCPAGENLCGGSCFLVTDPRHCGGCGTSCATGLCGATLTASMSNAPSGWTFNGSAQFSASGPSAELTVASQFNQAGTVFYDDPVAVDAFVVQFDFRMGAGGGSRSDGMGFVLAKDGATAVGGHGGGLGFAGLTGFGVELDIFDNLGVCGDVSNNHVGIDALDVCNTGQGTPDTLASSDVSSVLDLADAQWHAAEVTLSSGQMSVVLDGSSVASGVTLTGLSTGDAYYFGFSAGTGGLLAQDGGPGGYRQEVRNVRITFPTPRCL